MVNSSSTILGPIASSLTASSPGTTICILNQYPGYHRAPWLELVRAKGMQTRSPHWVLKPPYSHYCFSFNSRTQSVTSPWTIVVSSVSLFLFSISLWGFPCSPFMFHTILLVRAALEVLLGLGANETCKRRGQGSDKLWQGHHQGQTLPQRKGSTMGLGV